MKKVADLQFVEQEALSCFDKNILAEWEQKNSNYLNESSIIQLLRILGIKMSMHHDFLDIQIKSQPIGVLFLDSTSLKVLVFTGVPIKYT